MSQRIKRDKNTCVRCWQNEPEGMIYFAAYGRNYIGQTKIPFKGVELCKRCMKDFYNIRRQDLQVHFIDEAAKYMMEEKEEEDVEAEVNAHAGNV